MVSIGQLWLPILLSAIACHIIGFLVWMLLPHHRTDYQGLPEEAGVRALLKGKVAPGAYMIPHSAPEAMHSAEMKAKRAEGPNAFVIVLPNGGGNMMAMQVKNVLFHALVSFFVAYLAAATLPAGTEYLKVFQVAGTAGVLAYGFTWGHQAIWFGKPWPNALKDAFDGVLMGLVTAGLFGWLWPR